jgi:uncharacterized protein YlxW (UPF0749 family)
VRDDAVPDDAVPDDAVPDDAVPDGRAAPVPRSRRSTLLTNVVVALLCGGLGLAVVTQVRGQGSGDALDAARPADLVVLLDTLQQREASLREEVTALQSRVDTLRASGQDSAAALAEAQKEAAALAVLVGTAPASGPGVVLTLTDPARSVGPETVLDAVQELRAAGAEAIELRGADGVAVRVGLSSSVGGRAGAVSVDGTPLTAPTTVLAVGDPPTMAAALDIPGGVVDTVARAGGSLAVAQSDTVEVSALRALDPPQYAQPSR